MLTLSKDLKALYPDAKFGVLIIRDVKESSSNMEFDKVKIAAREELLSQYKNYNRKEFIKSEPAFFYSSYYKKFKKTYPVQLQLESIVIKEAPLPNTDALVEAMFIAELKNLLLTAGYDIDKMEFPLKLNLAQGNENFIGISQREQYLAKDDMMLSDGNGIISSILNGPDFRTRITKGTKNVMFFVYAPGGIDDDIILKHLYDIKAYVSIFSPHSTIDLLKIFN